VPHCAHAAAAAAAAAAADHTGLGLSLGLDSLDAPEATDSCNSHFVSTLVCMLLCARAAADLVPLLLLLLLRPHRSGFIPRPR
jgi:hypothetical protein